jgi:aminoglycoside phosphotransferase (APT) family kinase protein
MSQRYGRAVADQPGPVLGSGRSSVVYDLGDGTVLRRYRNPSQSVRAEADAMRAAAAAGVLVPRVRAAVGPDLVMDAVAGPSMLADLLAHPDRAEHYGGVLADLHRRLDRVPARSASAGLIHGDLHPGNVLLGADGPVLIDWTNSGWAERSLDVAVIWILLTCFTSPDPSLEPMITDLRGPFLDAFLRGVDQPAAAASLREAARIRHEDPATLPEEHIRIDQLCREHAP